MAVDYEGLKKILDQFPCGVLMAGDDGEVLLCNDKAPALLETELIDLMETGVAAAPAWSGLAEAVRFLGKEEHLRKSVEFARGRRRFSMIVAKDGLSLFGKECSIAMISDVTREKELEELRSRFFSEFLRRIKGPLTSVKTALSVLSSDKYVSLDEKSREVALLGHEEVQRLNGLLSDMGDLFALDAHDAGALLYLENVEVGSILNRSLRRARKSPKGRNREITAAWPEGAHPLRVVADYEKLCLVLNHLLDNALAYSPAGTPVRLSAAAVGEGVEIKVEDLGLGISPEDLPRVFERFFRSSHPTVAESQGGGLGLFLAKGFIELMGAAIRIESAPGAGTTVILSLPMAAEIGRTQ